MFWGAPSCQPGSARAAAATFGADGGRLPIPGLLLLGGGLRSRACGWGWEGEQRRYCRLPAGTRPGQARCGGCSGESYQGCGAGRGEA